MITFNGVEYLVGNGACIHVVPDHWCRVAKDPTIYEEQRYGRLFLVTVLPPGQLWAQPMRTKEELLAGWS